MTKHLGILTVILGAAVAVAAASGATRSTTSEGRVTTGLTISSTLDGTTVLPHRIAWQAKASVPSSSVQEVDFLIDGKLRWVKHKAPYFYGSDGDWLVTSFLTPGVHRFSVRVKTTTGRTATDVHAARVVKPGSVPANLDGRWERAIGAAQAGAGLAGIWRLRISPVGWSIVDPKHEPSLVDVAYLGSDRLESRGPIWTNPAGPPGSPTEGNGWCDAPYSPVHYRFAVSGSTLTLQLVGKDRCGGEHFIWAGVWNRSQ
jgi:hypothetical protein